MPSDVIPELEGQYFHPVGDKVHVCLDDFPTHIVNTSKKRNPYPSVAATQISVNAVENSASEINPFDKYSSQLILNAPKKPVKDPVSRTYSFKYVEDVSDFVKHIGSIKAETDDRLFQEIYQDVTANIKKYFDIEITISAIQQHGMMHKNRAVIKSLDALDLICDCESLKGTIRYVSQISGIIKTYELRNSWRKDENYDAFEVSGKINSLKTKLENLLMDYKKKAKNT